MDTAAPHSRQEASGAEEKLKVICFLRACFLSGSSAAHELRSLVCAKKTVDDYGLANEMIPLDERAQESDAASLSLHTDRRWPTQRPQGLHCALKNFNQA